MSSSNVRVLWNEYSLGLSYYLLCNYRNNETEDMVTLNVMENN